MLGDHDEHRPFEDFAVRHVMGGLDEAQSGTFRSHLLDCPECRARVGELRSIASELAEVERSERRERAVKRVETKEREAFEPEDEIDLTDPRPPRVTRRVTIAGLLLIVLLSIWNFVLRGQNEDLRAIAIASAESAETVNFGERWGTDELAADHTAVARMLEGKLAVLVRGTDDDATYRVSMFDGTGERLATYTVASEEAQVRWFGGPLRAAVVRVDVTMVRTNGETIVFRATEDPAPAAEPAGEPAIGPGTD
ncbi:hypothetical protein BH23ACT9_BH23ACT9_27660 [soil metagenome]